MKNQGLSLPRLLTVWGILVALWFGVSACSGTIRGRVCLDDNGNGVCDTDDRGAPSVKLTVRHNGELIATGYTNQLGEFRLGSKGKGTYCVQPSLDTLEKNLGGLSLGKAAVTAGTSTTQTCVDRNLDGLCDPATDAGSDDGKDSSSASDDKHDGSSSDSAASDDEKTSSWTASGFCHAIKGFDLEMNIPITIDHSTDEIPKWTEKTYEAGETFDLPIVAHKGCSIKPFHLPELLELAKEYQPGVSYKQDTDLVTIYDDAAWGSSAGSAKAAVASPSVSSPIDTARALTLKVKDDIPLGTTKTQIELVEECGSESIDLPSIPLALVRKIDVAVFADLKGARPGLGRTNNFYVTIENRGKSPVESGILSVELKALPAASVFLKCSDNRCHNQGLAVLCDIKDLKGGAKETLAMGFELPATLDGHTNFSIDADFMSDEEIKDSKDKPKSGSISFGIDAPEEPQNS